MAIPSKWPDLLRVVSVIFCWTWETSVGAQGERRRAEGRRRDVGSRVLLKVAYSLVDTN